MENQSMSFANPAAHSRYTDPLQQLTGGVYQHMTFTAPPLDDVNPQNAFFAGQHYPYHHENQCEYEYHPLLYSQNALEIPTLQHQAGSYYGNQNVQQQSTTVLSATNYPAPSSSDSINHADEQNLNMNGNQSDQHHLQSANADQQLISNTAPNQLAPLSAANIHHAENNDGGLPGGAINWFDPSDDELISRFLMKKLLNQRLEPNNIHQVKLMDFHPQSLADNLEPSNRTKWFFFTPCYRKYPKGTRPDRNAGGGYWKVTGVDTLIRCPTTNELLGYKTSLDYYEGDRRSSRRTKWKMHEFKTIQQNKKAPNNQINKEESLMLYEWVLCKLYVTRERRNKTNNTDNGCGGIASSTSQQQMPMDQNQHSVESEHPEEASVPDDNVNYGSGDIYDQIVNEMFEDNNQMPEDQNQQFLQSINPETALVPDDNE